MSNSLSREAQDWLSRQQVIRWDSIQEDALDAHRGAQFADCLRKNRHVEKLHLSGPISEEAANALTAAIKEHPSLRVVHFKGLSLSQPSLKALSDAALSLPQMESFQMRQAELSAPVLQHICQQAAKHERLHNICLSQNRIDSASLPAVCDMVSAPGWRRIRLMGCGLDGDAMTTIAQHLGDQPQLTRFHLQDNDEPPKEPEFSNALIATGSKNLLSIFPIGTQELTNFAIRNQHDGQKIVEQLLTAQLGGRPCSIVTHGEALERLPVLDFLTSHSSSRSYCEKYLSALPPLQEASSKGLLKPGNPLNQCPAENPLTWRDAESLFSAVEKAGETIDADWLKQQTPLGNSLLECAMAANAGPVVAVLNQRGICLRKEQLLTAEGTPSPVLEVLMARKNCAAFSTVSNWEGASRQEYREVLRAIAPEQRALISNRHQIEAQLADNLEHAVPGR